ncbi:MAG: hypothetical protein ACP5MH_10295 [Thermoproteus sp.]
MSECLPYEIPFSEAPKRLRECKRGVLRLSGGSRVFICHPCSPEEELMAVLGALL